MISTGTCSPSACRRCDRAAGSAAPCSPHTLAIVDAEHAPAYLEATSSRSRVLYERFGFEAITELVVDDSPTFWPMWRRPFSD